MSGGYASRLSEYSNKGICNLPEIVESGRTLKNKLTKFADLVKASEYITILTGAGISTSAGIPDFRGPKGIWTVEEKQKNGTKRARRDRSRIRDLKKPRLENEMIPNEVSSSALTRDEKDGIKIENKSPSSTDSFADACPTQTHRIITKLVECGKVNYVITQNVDGLHRRSGLPRSKHSVLHGCVFTEKCELCNKEYFRDFDVQGVSFQKTGRKCTIENCNGDLRDTILDWEDELPEEDFDLAIEHCEKSDLVIALGTSLRIEPAGSLPTKGKNFAIVNLQRTPYDDQAKIIIRARVDDVMNDLMLKLGIPL